MSQHKQSVNSREVQPREHQIQPKALGIYDCLAVFFSIILLGSALVAFRQTDSSLVDYKNYLLCIALMIIAALTLSIILFRYSGVFLSYEDLLVFCYVVYLATRALFSNNFNFDFGWIPLIWIVYFVTRCLANRVSFGGIKVLYVTLIIFMFLQSAWVFGQLAGWIPSLNENFLVTGSFFNPGPMGIYLTSFFPIVLAVAMKKTTFVLPQSLRLASLISTILMFGAIVVSLSRSAWVGLLTAIVIYLIYNYKKLRYVDASFLGKYRSYILQSIGIAIIGTFLYLIVQLKIDSAIGRLLVWKIGSNMSMEAPILGLGIGSVSDQYLRFQMEYFKKNEYSHTEAFFADKVESIYNAPLQILAEQGIIGFLLFFLILTSVVYPLFREQNFNFENNVRLNFKTLILLQVICLFTASLFSYAFETPHIFLNFVIFIALLVPTGKHIQSGNIHYRLVLLGFLAMLLFSAYISSKVADKYLMKEKFQEIVTDNKSIKTKIHLLDSLDHVYPQERLILNYLGKLLSFDGNNSESIKKLEQVQKHIYDPFLSLTLGTNYQSLKQFDLAEYHLINSINMIPNRLYPRFLLAKMYEEKGDFRKADSIAQVILEMPVKIESQATRRIKLEMTFLRDESGLQ